MQKLGLTLLISSFTLACLSNINCQQSLATTGDAAWYQEALTEPFRSQPASGTVDNDTLIFDVAEVRPAKKGMYTLDLMKQVTRGNFRILRVHFPFDGKFAGQTVTFPCTNGKLEASIDVFRGNKTKNLSKHCESKYIFGRIAFSDPKGSDIPGYICLHFRNKTIGSSQVNGYFHATRTKGRKRSAAMFD